MVRRLILSRTAEGKNAGPPVVLDTKWKLIDSIATDPQEISERPFVLGTGQRVWALAVHLERDRWGSQSEIAEIIGTVVEG